MQAQAWPAVEGSSGDFRETLHPSLQCSPLGHWDIPKGQHETQRRSGWQGARERMAENRASLASEAPKPLEDKLWRQAGSRLLPADPEPSCCSLWPSHSPTPGLFLHLGSGGKPPAHKTLLRIRGETPKWTKHEWVPARYSGGTHSLNELLEKWQVATTGWMDRGG